MADMERRKFLSDVTKVTIAGTFSASIDIHAQRKPPKHCTYALSSSSANAPASGTSGTVAVSTRSGCEWTAISNDAWIAVSGSGPGNGNVDYVVSPNTGEARTGTLTIAGQAFTVMQAASVPTAERTLLGGWRIAQEFARGAIAIDFSRMRLWMVGHTQRSEVLAYDLPSMGTGTDSDAWPRVDPVEVIPGFWPQIPGDGALTYANGLCFWQGKVWAAPRAQYAAGGDAAGGPLALYAEDGDTIQTTLPRQVFSGFVKRGPETEPLIGCGGYESGQGSSSGPSLATLDGTILLQYGWPALPGDNLEHWNDRAPRDTNYSVDVDSWVGWNPRTVDGQLEGRWASDRINAGGLVLPEGVTYWPYMGTGRLDYTLQSPGFAEIGATRTYEYTLDPSFRVSTFQIRPEFGWWGSISGHELGPDGKVYLSHSNRWTSGAYQTDVAVLVYG
jgi:hypothetical protein